MLTTTRDRAFPHSDYRTSASHPCTSAAYIEWHGSPRGFASAGSQEPAEAPDVVKVVQSSRLGIAGNPIAAAQQGARRNRATLGKSAMTYSTIMAHMELGSANDALLRVVAGLAKRFAARIVGIAGSQPMPVYYDDGFTSADMVQADVAEIAKEITEAETSFRSTLGGQGIDLAWRSITATIPLADYIVREARAADLIVTGPDRGFSRLNASRCVVVSDLVLHAGRPVLIVPPTANGLDLTSIVVGWQDTREARRAIADALPLLVLARRVALVEIVQDEEIAAARGRLDDVVAWLGRHGIAAEAVALPSDGDDSEQLRAFAGDRSADLMVTGAYGHHRLREWVLGGITRDLLARPHRCSLLSH